MRGRITTVLVGLVAGAVLLALTDVSAWADGGATCRGGAGHAVGMSRHGLSGHGGMSGHLLHHLLRHKQELGLTDDQVAKLRTLSLDQDRARIRAHADMLVAKRELRALAWDDSAELSAIEAKIKESEALEATLKFMAVKGRRELKGVLTPEQRAKLKAWWEQRQHEPGARPMRAEAEESGEREELAEGTTGLTEIELSETGDGQPVS